MRGRDRDRMGKAFFCLIGFDFSVVFVRLFVCLFWLRLDGFTGSVVQLGLVM